MIFLALLSSASLAASWCAAPLIVHEWGVQVFSGPEAVAVKTELPSWFYSGPGALARDPVRLLPADSGLREIPVLQFYTERSAQVPVGIEAGFTGLPSSWYPQVDRFSTSGLAWDALTLTREAVSEPRSSSLGWIESLREHGMWVSRGAETERFIYYEAATHEKPALELHGNRVTNTSSTPAHDIVLIRDGAVGVLDRLEAGQTADLGLENTQDVEQLVRAYLTQRLLEDPPDWSESGFDRGEADYLDLPGMSVYSGYEDSDCVMMRDPAIPVSSASGHKLFEHELSVLLDTWAPRFAAGDALIYRDDEKLLEEQAPLAIYTDMSHFVRLSRAGLVFWEGI